MYRNAKLSEIISDYCAPFIGEDVTIHGLNLVNRITAIDSVLSYVTNDRYIIDVEKNLKITALILPVELYDYYIRNISRKITYILSESPEILFYEIHEFLVTQTDFYEKFDFESSFGVNFNIHKSVVIEDGVIIGNNVSIGANSVIRSGTIIEDSVAIGCNSTIGSEGFQIIEMSNELRKIHHVGRTKICKRAFVGDNCAIDNSLFEGFVEIGEGVYIGSLCSISHNCNIHKNAVITSGVILCGSVTIEENAWVGMNTTILNKVVVGKRSKIGIGSVVTRDIPEDVIAYGSPARVARHK